MSNNQIPAISAATIARFAILLLGLINAALVMFGVDTIPIADETVNQLVALSWNVGAALWAWWKDNPVTTKSRARHADNK
ncbi:phage holin [Bifidobacterium callitrichidarum]|uniref:Phage holin n=1 Tax=Bifidobacterium callitrichidarum TaxID=2052941 RepID=A0A2U2N7H2_9BIFI|nr:phage holin [Bifidobacterium callitrichidarum]PWG65042.1 phage holin [Bifidobacterium callitrichidarum]